MQTRRVIAASLAGVFGLSVVLAAVVPFLGGDDGGPSGSSVVVTAASDAGIPSRGEGAPLPDVTLSDLDGNAVPFRSLAGRPMVVNYWYVSCPPCKEEMPAIAAVAAELGDRVRFVGINPQDTAGQARSFMASIGVTYEQLLDRTRRSVDELALTGFPSTLFVGADGRVLHIQRAEMTEATLRSLVEQYLAP